MTINLRKKGKITPWQKKIEATMKFTWCSLEKRKKNVNGLRMEEDNWFFNEKKLSSTAELCIFNDMQTSTEKLQELDPHQRESSMSMTSESDKWFKKNSCFAKLILSCIFPLSAIGVKKTKRLSWFTKTSQHHANSTTRKKREKSFVFLFGLVSHKTCIDFLL